MHVIVTVWVHIRYYHGRLSVGRVPNICQIPDSTLLKPCLRALKNLLAGAPMK